jgi:hypothetical protein
MRVSRRQVQRVLGALWLLDGVLQLQPFMFGRGFADQVLTPAAQGQPSWVAGPVQFFAGHVGAHPVVFNAMFAAVQLLIGAGLLLGRTARPALGVSIIWSLGVWWFGEGLGGLASGHATLITGAPGAAALYALLAAAVWPRTGARTDRVDTDNAQPAQWLTVAWATLWIGGAALQSLPGQNQTSEITAQLRDNTEDAPGWLSALTQGAAHVLDRTGTPLLIVLIVLMVLSGLAALRPGALRLTAVTIGTVLAIAFWLLGQNLGGLDTGQATDPNTGPLLLLMVVCLLSTSTQRRGERRRTLAPSLPQASTHRLTHHARPGLNPHTETA